MFQNIFGFLIAWYNLPYTIFMVLGVLIAVLQLFGLSHDGDADADMDADVDADLDADMDADADVDGDLDHDIDHDVDHDVDGGASSGLAWLAFIGVGKAPLMVVLLILLFSTGLLGWLLNSIMLGTFGILSGLLVLVGWLMSLSVGIFITSRVTRTIGRVLPPISSTATKAQAMVGMNGTVTSPFVDAKYGMIHLRDQGGTLVSLFAITEDEKPIPRGQEVLLVSYDTVQKRYIVTRR